MSKRHLVWLIFVLSLCSVGLFAQATGGPWNVGDVLVGVGAGQYNQFRFSQQNTPIGTVSVGGSADFTGNCSFDGQFNFYGTNYTAGKIVEVVNNQQQTTSTVPLPFTVNYPLSAQVEDLVSSASGNIFAGNSFVVSGVLQSTDNIAKLTQVGAPANDLSQTLAPGTISYSVNTALFTGIRPRAVWSDLASDQKTLFYTSCDQFLLTQCTNDHAVYKLDLTNGSVTTFSTNLPSNNSAMPLGLRLLPPFDSTGGVLVADDDSIQQLNGSGGNMNVTYKTTGGSPTFTAVALDPDGVHFWAIDAKNSKLYQYPIATQSNQTVSASLVISKNQLSIPTGGALGGLCVKGGPQRNVIPLQFACTSKTSACANVKQVATFDAGIAQHSFSETYDSINANTSFTLVVSATLGLDYQRFNEYFTNQAPPASPTTLQAIPYAGLNPVVYRAENPPSTTLYSSTGGLGIKYNIGYTPPSPYQLLTCETSSNPRLMRDPSEGGNGAPIDFQNHQFVWDATSESNSNGPVSDGYTIGTGVFGNDYALVDRCPADPGSVFTEPFTAVFNSPLQNTSQTIGSQLPIKVGLTDANGNFVSDAVNGTNGTCTCGGSNTGGCHNMTINVFGPLGSPSGSIEAATANSFTFFTKVGKAYSGVLQTGNFQPGPTSICVTSVGTCTVNNNPANLGTGTQPGEFPPLCEIIQMNSQTTSP